MFSVLKRTLTHEELLKNKETGNPNIQQDLLAGTRYANRWEMCDKLFSKWNDSMFFDTERRILNPDNQSKFYFYYKPTICSINFDVYSVPLNLEVMNREKYIFDEFDSKTIKTANYMSRTKFVIKEKEVTDFYLNRRDLHDDTEYRYFMDMFVDYCPILNEYKTRYFSDVDSTFTMNIIRYEVPFATEDDVKLQRYANSVLWGVPHYDQAYMGLHLGESHKEFVIRNDISEDLQTLPFEEEINTVLMWGDPLISNTEFNGTFHGMNGPFYKKVDTDTKRYSIIFNIDMIDTQVENLV